MRAGVVTAGCTILLSLTRGALADRETDTRVATFHDGLVPRIAVSGDRYVHGELDLEIRFADTNSLCFAYTVGGESVRGPAQREELTSNDAISSSAVSATFEDIRQAQTAIESSLRALGRVSLEASRAGSLDQVWDACAWANPPSRVMPAQLRRISEVERLLSSRLASQGAWTRILAQATETAAAVRRQSPALAQTAADLAARELARHNLDAQTDELERLLASTLAIIQHAREELRRAHTRLASSPSPVVRHYSEGENVVVEVSRTRLDRGRRVDAGETVNASAQAFRTLPRIWFDVGLGPALTLHNTKNYALGQRFDERVPNITRTEDTLNFDGLLSVSMYVWGARYLDDGLFRPVQLLPRPMVGLSMRQPFKSIYFGGQVDPIQFLDFSFGGRLYASNDLVAPEREGLPAYTDAHGEPAPPVVREVVTLQLFVSLTASTDLFQRWIVRSL